MSVKAILKVKGRRVVTAAPTATMADVIGIMARERIGAVVISENGHTVAGIVSERDIVQSLHRHGVGLLAIPAKAVMTETVITAHLEMHIEQVMELMTVGRFRHMPVVEKGELVGIISIGDIVKARLESLESEANQLKEYIVGR
jgi:CBS domain-containing protein